MQDNNLTPASRAHIVWELIGLFCVLAMVSVALVIVWVMYHASRTPEESPANILRGENRAR